MTKSKFVGVVFLTLFVVSLILQAGCASGGMKRPIVYSDQANNIPADIPSQFLNRYERFVTGKESKEFKKLLTDEERQVFIDKFWLERDTDPSTPENEYKQEVDEKIADIAGERFFNTASITGLLFRSNGGFRGDMARVYLLHGEPDAMDIVEGNSFVPLMLWVYVNPENGELLYAFMFYQKSGSGEFQLFYQDSYKMDQCGAIYEVATMRAYNYPGNTGACSEDLYEVYNEIIRSSGRGGVLDGNIFAWALFNFSSDFDLRLDEALDPPKPASEVAKKSKARVVGEAPELVGKAGTDYLLASCEGCNSLIPAELSLKERFTVSGPWRNFDWVINGDEIKLSLKYRISFQDTNTGSKMAREGLVVLNSKKSFLDESPQAILLVDLLEPEEIADIPSGKYRVSVYVKNTLTQKYNAWERQFTK